MFSVCGRDNLLRTEAVLLDYISWWDGYVIWGLWLFIYWPIFSSKFRKDREKKKKHVGMWFLSGNFSERIDVENIGPDLIIRPSTAMFYFLGWAYILSILCLSCLSWLLIAQRCFPLWGQHVGYVIDLCFVQPESVFCPFDFWLAVGDDLLYPLWLHNLWLQFTVFWLAWKKKREVESRWWFGKANPFVWVPRTWWFFFPPLGHQS